MNPRRAKHLRGMKSEEKRREIRRERRIWRGLVSQCQKELVSDDIAPDDLPRGVELR